MVSSCSDPVIQKKKTLGHIYDTELNDHRHVGHCVHARVVVYMYLTGQNISAICISPMFIEPVN